MRIRRFVISEVQFIGFMIILYFMRLDEIIIISEYKNEINFEKYVPLLYVNRQEVSESLMQIKLAYHFSKRFEGEN